MMSPLVVLETPNRGIADIVSQLTLRAERKLLTWSILGLLIFQRFAEIEDLADQMLDFRHGIYSTKT